MTSTDWRITELFISLQTPLFNCSRSKVESLRFYCTDVIFFQSICDWNTNDEIMDVFEMANNRASQLLIVAFCTYTKFIAASDVSIES